MVRLTLIGTLVATLLLAWPASATTRYVDDDRAQCTQAAHTTIQAAIDAASASDLIQVCAGHYAEQVTLPTGKPGLFLNSPASSAATIVAPLSGLDATGDEAESQMDLVRIDGAGQHVEGFALQGPLTPRPQVTPCLSSGIAIHGDDAFVADVHISGITDLAVPPGGGGSCNDNPQPGIGIRVSGQQDTVDRSVVTGARIGIALYGAFDALILRNTIVGRGSAGESTGLAGGIPLYGGSTGAFRSNEVSSAGAGMKLAFWNGNATSNNLHDNGSGLVIEDNTSGAIRSNFLRYNVVDGLSEVPVPRYGLGRNLVVITNQVRGNGRDGLSITGCDWFFCGTPGTNSFTRLERNTSLGNGRYDCLDDEKGENTWINNIGVTDSPNVCSRPR